MTGVLGTIISGYLILFTLQLVLWLIQSRTRNATTADIGWSIGMALLVYWYALQLDGYWIREVIVIALVTAWSARLSSHLIARMINDAEEDSRYAQFREDWGANANRNFFVIYQLQPIFNLILAVPFLLMFLNPSTSIHWIEIFGIVLWVVGLVGESVADIQLDRFKRQPQNKGKICQEGLWAYSRHPNFFFEWWMWVSYAVMCLGSPLGYLGTLAPAFMLFLLMKVTGIPIMEKNALRIKGEAFREYMRTTSFFIPLPRKA